MRTNGSTVEGVVAAALAVVLLAGALCGPAAAEGSDPISGGKTRYKLPAAALAALPTGIALEKLAQRLPERTAPPGIQYFQSPSGLAGMYLHSGAALDGNRLFFPLQNEWTFLRDRRFQQGDTRGNRLIIDDGKAQVFNSAGQLIGTLQDPAIRRLYTELLRLTM